MSLDPKDLEAIERIIYKNADDVAVSIARSFERMEERIDSTEARLNVRIAEVEDRIESGRQEAADSIGAIREELRHLGDAV
jgi:hypothetical protein